MKGGFLVKTTAPFAFEWRRGECWGVVGPNGSGKSRLLALLRQEWRAGEVEYGFRGRMGCPPASRIACLSMEEQREVMERFDVYAQMRWNSTDEEFTPTLLDWLSQDAVEDVLPYEVVRRTPGQVAAFARRRESLLRTLGLAALAEHRLASLSNGEMRRAFLARCLLLRPRLLLLDAPLTGLDAESRRIMEALLNRLASGRSTSVMTAATQSEDLPAGTTHLLRLNADGTVAYSGTAPAALRRRFGRVAASPVPGAAAVRFSHAVPVDESAAPVVEFRDIAVRYGDHVVLEHFSWTIRAGERWLLLGPNGSGKTTLIAFMQGDHPQAYANDVRLFGRARGTGESIWEIKARVGWVSPELQLCMYAGKTALDIVLDGLNDSPFDPPATGRAARAAGRRELALFAPTVAPEVPFGELSAGEQRLVLLARAFVKNPPLLLLDEPCQNLDDTNRRHLLSVLDARCTGSGTTLVYVTHLRRCVPGCVQHTARLG